MEGIKVIDIAKDFGRYLGGRLREDGPLSGEEFRESLLIPALNDYRMVEVKLDGVAGYPASFLEEAFGGAVVKLGYDQVSSRVKLTASRDPYVIEEIKKYMTRASQGAQ